MTPRIYQVSELSHELKRLLEKSYPTVWVEGEIYDHKQAASGHHYFHLKEDDTLLRCVMFKGSAMKSPARPKQGMQATLKGQVTLYRNRGDLQLLISYCEEAGEGALRREFAALQAKLKDAGWFDEANKQTIPEHCQDIALITSSRGAVIHDIANTLSKRYPATRVTLFDCAVQGAEAVTDINQAIQQANAIHQQGQRHFDVIILARGGGSLDDLRAFNDESVASAIFASSLPVLSAVGHETDITIADWVADERAATPTAAATRISPDQGQLLAQVKQQQQHLLRYTEQRLQGAAQRVDFLQRRLQNPRTQLVNYQQRVKQSQQRLALAAQRVIAKNVHQQQLLLQSLQNHAPDRQLSQHRMTLAHLQQRLEHGYKRVLQQKQNHWQILQSKLSAMGPGQVLERGYSILWDEQGQALRDPAQASPQQRLRAQLAQGELTVVVDEQG